MKGRINYVISVIRQNLHIAVYREIYQYLTPAGAKVVRILSSFLNFATKFFLQTPAQLWIQNILHIDVRDLKKTLFFSEIVKISFVDDLHVKKYVLSLLRCEFEKVDFLARFTIMDAN